MVEDHFQGFWFQLDTSFVFRGDFLHFARDFAIQDIHNTFWSFLDSKCLGFFWLLFVLDVSFFILSHWLIFCYAFILMLTLLFFELLSLCLFWFQISFFDVFCLLFLLFLLLFSSNFSSISFFRIFIYLLWLWLCLCRFFYYFLFNFCFYLFVLFLLFCRFCLLLLFQQW